MEEQFELLASLAQHCVLARNSLSETPEHYIKSLYKASLAFQNAVSFEMLIKKEAVGKHRTFWLQFFPEVGHTSLSERFLACWRGLDVYNQFMPADEYERLEWRIRLRQQFLNALLAHIIGLEATMKVR